MPATVDLVVTEVPVALEDSLTLTAGLLYTVSNDSDVIVLYRIAVDVPDADARGHALRPYRDVELEYVAGGEKTWVWTRDPPASLVITDNAQ